MQKNEKEARTSVDYDDDPAHFLPFWWQVPLDPISLVNWRSFMLDRTDKRVNKKSEQSQHPKIARSFTLGEAANWIP